MTIYSKHFSPKSTPQSQPIPGTDQVPNAAGGYVWEVDRWARLRRFLILGTEGGTYYIDERELTVHNSMVVVECLAEGPDRVIKEIVDVSTQRLAPKVGPSLFALALACSPTYNKMPTDRDYALSVIPDVVGTGSHLLEFVANIDALRGWGRSIRRAVANWYLSKSGDSLAYQIEKYKNRKGWSHAGVLAMSHPKPLTNTHNAIFGYISRGNTEGIGIIGGTELIADSIAANKATTKGEIIALIKKRGLTHEMIPTRWLDEKDVWIALLDKIPAIALLRNLGRMSAYGVFGDSLIASSVAKTISNPMWVNRSKIHPMTIFLASKTYGRGTGNRGKLSWKINPQIIQALELALVNSLDTVESTGLNIIAGVDVSGSMFGSFYSSRPPQQSWEPIEAAALMVTMLIKSESRDKIGHVNVIPFNTGPLKFMGYNDSFATITNQLREMGGGGTDVAIPILLARQEKYRTDAFIIYTDSETWAGNMHPQQAFDAYKREVNPKARLVIVSMVANQSTVGDPKDPSVLNVVGLDASVPGVINDFITGRI